MIVSNGQTIHYGVMVESVDEPPVVVAGGMSLYAHVWRARGWTIEIDSL